MFSTRWHRRHGTPFILSVTKKKQIWLQMNQRLLSVCVTWDRIVRPCSMDIGHQSHQSRTNIRLKQLRPHLIGVLSSEQPAEKYTFVRYILKLFKLSFNNNRYLCPFVLLRIVSFYMIQALHTVLAANRVQKSIQYRHTNTCPARRCRRHITWPLIRLWIVSIFIFYIKRH